MYYNQRYNNNFNYSCNENDFYYKDDYKNDYNQNQYNKKPCCVKRVEETICCYPSYYNEEKKEEKKEDCKKDYNCWEGYFKLCGSYKDNQNDYYNQNNKSCHENKNEHQCKRHNCCGFCGLFKRW